MGHTITRKATQDKAFSANTMDTAHPRAVRCGPLFFGLTGPGTGTEQQSRRAP
jgi:hypothetical protein